MGALADACELGFSQGKGFAGLGIAIHHAQRKWTQVMPFEGDWRITTQPGTMTYGASVEVRR